MKFYGNSIDLMKAIDAVQIIIPTNKTCSISICCAVFTSKSKKYCCENVQAFENTHLLLMYTAMRLACSHCYHLKALINEIELNRTLHIEMQGASKHQRIELCSYPKKGFCPVFDVYMSYLSLYFNKTMSYF